MGIQFSIESDEAYRMAELTALKERLRGLAQDIEAHMREPATSDHGWLYDAEAVSQ
jgi:hypothetical protein